MTALLQRELRMKVAQLLGLWGPWQHVCRDTDCLCLRNYGPIRVFFFFFFELLVAGDQKASLGSLSLKPRPLRGFPSRGPSLLFRTSGPQRDPSLGSYPVAQCVRCLMGQPLCCSAANAMGECMRGEAMVMTPPTTGDSAALSWSHCCLAFLHRHFPSQPPLSHPLDQSLRSQQQPGPGITP